MATTGQKMPTANTERVVEVVSQPWATPNNLHTGGFSTSPEETDSTTNTQPAPFAFTNTHSWENFDLLSENGGAIPTHADLKIASVKVEMRVRIENSTGALDTMDSEIRGSVRKSAGTILTAPTGGGQQAFTTPAKTSASSTFLWEWPGTVAAPQTEWTRAQLADGEIRGYLVGTRPNGLVGSSVMRCYWMAVTVVYSIRVDKAGGAIRPGEGGGPKNPFVNKVGGSINPLIAGGPKIVTTVKAGGSVVPRVGGGPQKTAITKAGGSFNIRVGGGFGKPLISKLGGSINIRTAGGPKIVTVVRAGGGVSPGFAGGTKLATVTKAGGSTTPRVGGGVQKTAVIKTGGSFNVRVAGGPQNSIVARVGGSFTIRTAGGSKTVASVRAGGSIRLGVGGATKNPIVGKAGGSDSPRVGGGTEQPLIGKAGGSTVSVTGGGPKIVAAAKEGGGVWAGVGGAVQYSVYTFAVKGYSRDGTNGLIPGAKVSCFRQDNYTLIANNPIQTSDLVTGAYAFRVSNPEVDPTTYWVRGIKFVSPNVFGTTDEDLVPAIELVQGGEL